MCYTYGSVDQPPCPMCKVFRPSGARCPHIRDVCRNRSFHPRHDVVHLKNAEVKSFNGCGFCKWAKTNPPPSQSGYQNPGWPGCCRPPNPNEQRYIQAADWHSVNVVHSVPIPPDIRSLLESLSSGNSPIPTGGVRIPAMPLMDRRNSSNTSSTKPTSPSAKTAPVSIPSKAVGGGSPQFTQSTLSKVDSRAGGVPSSLPSASPLDQYQSQRRYEQADKSRSPSSRNSPSRKFVELEGNVSRHHSAERPSVSKVTPSSSVSKVTIDAQMQGYSPPASLRHRSSVSSTHPPNLKPSPPSSRTGDRQSATFSIRPPPKRPNLELSMAAVTLSGIAPPNISSASSNSSGSGGSSRGSMTDSTVTSDGGFTDYLSDESEAELQRQAEVKAAIVAQNQAEEQEFKAARQQLADVDLRPPKSWNHPTSNTRLPGRPMNAYYAQGAMAQAGAPTRG